MQMWQSDRTRAKKKIPIGHRKGRVARFGGNTDEGHKLLYSWEESKHESMSFLLQREVVRAVISWTHIS